MLFGTMKVVDNELNIGGIQASKLVQKYGSPLYVFDKAHLENMIDTFQTNFKSNLFEANVAYASKTFLTKKMAALVNDKKMCIDLVSLGEMFTAKNAGFNMENALFHGNNKSKEELKYALDSNVGVIVVDNKEELKDLIDLANQSNQKVKTLLRVNPGVEAHTHEYIITAKLTSKFGESIFDQATLNEIMDIYQNNEFVSLEGFHCHIGSQIFEESSFIKTIDVMSDFIQEIENSYNITINALNLGGGFGVFYTDKDKAVDIASMCKRIVQKVESQVQSKNLHIKKLYIEPGRSITANAGVTLYTVGYNKKTYGGKHYVFVDGGMSDNIRPALYQAEYSADIATNMNGLKGGTYTVAGKLCESGDIIIENTNLQPFKKGDILAVYATGAYNYSMASNYNRMLKPAVVFVKDGNTEVVVKRETLEDLIRNDC